MRFPLRIFGLMLVLIVFMVCCNSVSGQTSSEPNDKNNLIDPEGILHELAPGTIPLDSLNPKPANRARAIRLLMDVKRQNTGWNRQQAVYLLSLLGHDYVLNRDELLQAWHHCVVEGYEEDCNEETAMALIGLYKQGHKELLRQLLAGCRNSDGALSEELYPFYAEQLERNTRDFLAALAIFPNKEQQHICESAAWKYDDGIDPETLRKVHNRLMKIGGVVADHCARSYKVGGQAAEDANRDNPVNPPK